MSIHNERSIERQLRRLQRTALKRQIGKVTSVAPLRVTLGSGAPGGDPVVGEDGQYVSAIGPEPEQTASVLTSYSPQVGDRVWVSRAGSDILIHGAIGEATIGGPGTGSPGGVGGGNSGLEFYPENYGAKGNDFTHDDTPGIQAAIDAAMDYGRGGIVRLDPTKAYLLAGPLRRDRNGNCILSIADEIDSAKPISIVGSYEPIGWNSPQATLVCVTPAAYSSTYGPPSVIGGATEENGGLWRNWCGPVTMRGFRIVLAENASIAGIDGLSFGGFDFNCVSVMAGDGKSATTANTNPHAFGIRTCSAYGFNHHYLRGGYVMQMHTGYVLPVTDHLWMENPAAYKCRIGLGIQTPYSHGNHAANGLSMSVEHCQYALAAWDGTSGAPFPTATGVAKIMFQDLRLDIELGDGLEPGTDFHEIVTVLDANNAIYANMKVHRVSGLGVANSPGPFYGGTNIRVEQVVEGAYYRRWSPHYMGASAGTGSPTANNAYFAEVFIGGTGIVSGIEFRPANTTGQVKSILYDRNGTILAQRTSGVTLAGAALGQQQQVAFSTSYQVTPGLYFIGLAFNNASSSYMTLGATTRGGTVGTSYTTPVNITPPTNLATVPYMHLY
jgi:hypothetical protein